MTEQTALRVADAGERKTIYSFMKKQFPPDELKPLRAVEDLTRRGIYETYGLWAGETLIAYALLGCDPGRKYWLLDYFGVVPERQNAGWGGRMLGLIRAQFPERTILIEVEDPDSPSADAENARRRIRFYERNGCRMTDVGVWLFGVDYRIMEMPARGIASCDARCGMEAIYRGFLPKLVYRRFVRFREDEP